MPAFINVEPCFFTFYFEPPFPSAVPVGKIIKNCFEIHKDVVFPQLKPFSHHSKSTIQKMEGEMV